MEREKLLTSKEHGLLWVTHALPEMVAVVREIKEVEREREKEMEPAKELVNVVREQYDERLKPLKELDTKLRTRALEENTENDTVTAEGVGMMIVMRPWAWEVADIKEVPKEYLTVSVDSAKVARAVKDGMRKIKGLNIYQGRVLQIRAEKGE
jgi:hypothetical protein